MRQPKKYVPMNKKLGGIRLNHQISFFMIAAKDLVSSGNRNNTEGRRITALMETRGTGMLESNGARG